VVNLLLIVENQFTILAGEGAAAIAVVRLSGPRVAGFLERHFSKRVSVGKMVHGELRDGDRVIDDPLVILLREDLVELNLHGGPWVLHAVKMLAERGGFVAVPWRESVIAFDTVDIIEREVLASLADAKTELAVSALLNQPSAWQTLNVSAMSAAERRAMLADRSLHWLLHPPRVAIVGPPNVGKSTLANALFGQERSITADLPGTTRDWVGELANINGLVVMLVDTPGRRETSDAIEAAAIAASSRQIELANLTIAVLDLSRELDSEQRQIIDAFPDAIRVANKADLPARWDAKLFNAMLMTATDDQSVERLRVAILRRFGLENFDPARPRVWTDRQRAVFG